MLIGFTGHKGVGKDTAAQHLIDTFDFTKLAFADKLKEAVARLFDIELENVDKFKSGPHPAAYNVSISVNDYGDVVDMPWREFLQRFGTEMGRETFWNDFWVDLWNDSYNHLVATGVNDIVVTDVRFDNEADEIHKLEGIIVEITRPGHKPDGHASEESLPANKIDARIANNGSIKALEIDVYDLYKALTHGD